MVVAVGNMCGQQ